MMLTELAVSSVQSRRQALPSYHQQVLSAFGEERFLHLIGEIAQLEEILKQEAEKVGGDAP